MLILKAFATLDFLELSLIINIKRFLKVNKSAHTSEIFKTLKN